MIVHVKLYASLRRYRPDLALGESFTCAISNGATVEQLLAELLKVTPGEVAIPLVNGVKVELSHRLADGDNVALFPPIAGGAAPPARRR